MNYIRMRNNQKIIFCILLLIQILAMIWWGCQKSGYYWDEYFTFDNAHYISQSTPDRVQLIHNPLVQWNKWIRISDLKESFVVRRESSLLADGFLYTFERFIRRDPYAVLLNLTEAIGFDGRMSKWAGISVNIFLFLITQVTLYTLGERERKGSGLIAVAIYGFSGMAISMTIFIRHYMFVTCCIMLCVFLHNVMLQTRNLYITIICELISVLLVYLSFRLSPLVALLAVGVIGGFAVLLLIEKRWLQCGLYVVPLSVGGLWYLWVNGYLKTIMQPTAYIGNASYSAESALLSNAMGMQWNDVLERGTFFFKTSVNYLIGSKYILACWCILIIACVAWNKRQKRHPVVKLPNRFGWLLAVALFVFFSFSILFGTMIERYISFVFPLLTFEIAIIVIDVANDLWNKKWMKGCLAVLILLGAGYTIYVPRVEYLYREDKATVSQIAAYETLDSVIINYGALQDVVLDECIAYADETSQVRLVLADDMCVDDWGEDELLVWQQREIETTGLTALEQLGYSLEPVGETYISQIYYCTKNE